MKSQNGFLKLCRTSYPSYSLDFVLKTDKTMKIFAMSIRQALYPPPFSSRGSFNRLAFKFGKNFDPGGPRTGDLYFHKSRRSRGVNARAWRFARHVCTCVTHAPVVHVVHRGGDRLVYWVFVFLELQSYFYTGRLFLTNRFECIVPYAYVTRKRVCVCRRSVRDCYYYVIYTSSSSSWW